jgi:hypothetical protein
MTVRPSSADMADPALARQATIDGLDHLAREMETRWGVGRLRLLVGDFLRTKFDAQTEKFNAALQEGKPEFVAVQAEGMRRAWAYLDKAAREAGHRPLDPNVWEIFLPSAGIAVALVRTEAEAHAVAKDRVVFTTKEIGMLLEKMPPAIRRVKEHFPGALITGFRSKTPKPFDWSKGDDIPF